MLIGESMSIGLHECTAESLKNILHVFLTPFVGEKKMIHAFSKTLKNITAT